MRAFLFALLALTVPALAANPAAGVVTSVSGKVTIYELGADKGAELKLASPLHAGDRIKTGANGKAVLVLSDGTRLNVNYNTDITLRDKDSSGKSGARGIVSIKIALGELWAKVTKKDSKLEFDTPAAVAAVKGTEPGFIVGDNGTQTCIYLLSGAMQLTNGSGSADMGALTQACLNAKSKLSQDLIKKWDGSNAPKDLNGTASGAEVTIKYQGADGQTKALDLRYSK
jgi:hypothetical protein